MMKCYIAWQKKWDIYKKIYSSKGKLIELIK